MDYSSVFAKIISHSKEYGFIFPSSELYDNLGAVYDYGPYGVLLKNNLKNAWWKSMVQLNENIVGLDSAILMHPKIWKASGHVDAFNDPLIDNKDSKKRYRADVLIEDTIRKYQEKSLKDTRKKAKKEGWEENDENFNRYFESNRNAKKAKEILERLVKALESDDLQELKQIILDYKITDPETGSANWTDVRQFNLMFKTQLGAASDSSSDIYMRPETAQGIFVNFLNVQKTTRQKIPFGIAQIGKAFRNEIVARQFIFRMREFEQMEMQFFVRPGSQAGWFEHWKNTRREWHENLGIKPEMLAWHDHEKLAHYADNAIDIEFNFPFGFKEIEGIHSRTDFDLTRHHEFSGKKIQYYDSEIEESYTPFVVETSVGLDRIFLMHLCQAYTEEEVPSAKGGSETRIVLKLDKSIAPIQAAIFPLVRKDELVAIAKELFEDLKSEFMVEYEEKDSIGKRYRRQDAKGTPFCITIDFDNTLENKIVTIRDRDTLEQENITIDQVKNFLRDKFNN